MASRRLRYSRWKRLPAGFFRSGERHPIDGEDQLQPLSIYVPGRVLDQADRLASVFRSPSIQAFCERLLPEALNMVQVQVRLASSEQTRAVLKAIDALDHGLLARLMPEALEADPWVEAEEVEETPEIRVPLGDQPLAPEPFEARATTVGAEATPTALETLLEAAGLAGDSSRWMIEPSAFEPVRVAEVMGAIQRLESAWRGSITIDRRAALALCRLMGVVHGLPTQVREPVAPLIQAIERLVEGSTGTGDDDEVEVLLADDEP